MVSLWVSLQRNLSLQDVQAAINIIIDVLCAAVVFVFVRVLWQRAAVKVAKQQHVSLPSLLSIGSPGDAFDAVVLLKKKLFTAQFAMILIQCLVVIFMSAIAIASGPLARFSCRTHTVNETQRVTGSLAARSIENIDSFLIEWDNTTKQLDQAGFPDDQLLDFMPDSTVPWMYMENEWNNTWSLTCDRTENTPLTLRTTAARWTDSPDIADNFPGLEVAFQAQAFNVYSASKADYYLGSILRDILVFIYAVTDEDYSAAERTARKLQMAFLVVHLQGVMRNMSDTGGDYPFLDGPVASAAFSKIQCTVARQLDIVDTYDVAWPDVSNAKTTSLTSSIATAYTAQLMALSASGLAVPLPDTHDLLRFYQSYFAVKDTLIHRPVTRLITVAIKVVQISTIFLVVVSIVIFLLLLGTCSLGIFAVRHNDVATSTPQSKLDWMMQSIQSHNRSPLDSKGRPRWSVSTPPVVSVSHSRSTKRRRAEFSLARYAATTSAIASGRNRMSTPTPGPPPTYTSVPQYVAGDADAYNVSSNQYTGNSNENESNTQTGLLSSSWRPWQQSHPQPPVVAGPTELSRFPDTSLRSVPSYTSDQFDNTDQSASLYRPYSGASSTVSSLYHNNYGLGVGGLDDDDDDRRPLVGSGAPPRPPPTSSSQEGGGYYYSYDQQPPPSVFSLMPQPPLGRRG
ncbi:hypothetical protein DV736_g6466, partial [Chaetothyriales sp. CBS 134916]